MHKKKDRKKSINELLLFEIDPKVVSELEQIGFSIDCLKVGESVPLPLLMEHIDNHSSVSVNWGVKAELESHKVKALQDVNNRWWSKKFDKGLRKLSTKSKQATAKQIEAWIYVHYGEEWEALEKELRNAENKLGLLKVIVKGFEIKGWMLGALKDIKLKPLELGGNK